MARFVANGCEGLLFVVFHPVPPRTRRTPGPGDRDRGGHPNGRVTRTSRDGPDRGATPQTYCPHGGPVPWRTT